MQFAYTYSFGGSATNGFNFFQQQQIDPITLKVMQIANTDPLVNAFCRANNIQDAAVLKNILLTEGKKLWEAKLKTYTEEQILNLTPELERGYDPNNVQCKHDHTKEFESFYIQIDDEHSIFQCSCGLIVVDQDPKTVIDEHNGGHYGYSAYHKKNLNDLPPMTKKTKLKMLSG